MKVTLRESKARLSELVRKAAQGEEVIITVRGKPEARLGPVGPEEDGLSFSKWEKTLREGRETYSTRKRPDGDIWDELRGDRQA